ncbi:MAG: AbrB/MazE/SpoVT family DNA-binding domain-containing protein [Pleurocapsa sp. SU_196_0]|nr:AbrB/MazE/SpoVT family DNA-binding domain-containing protein [Pleurocapsa sp. SU_196_0]
MDETVKLDARGRVVLPDGWLERWGVKPGDAVTLKLESGSLRLTPRRIVISGFVGRFSRPTPPPKPRVSKAETTGSSETVSALETTEVDSSANEAESNLEAVGHGA